MSQQLTFSAAVCVLTMALFALTMGSPQGGAGVSAAQPITLTAIGTR